MKAMYANMAIYGAWPCCRVDAHALEAPSNIGATGIMFPLNDFIDQTPDVNIDDIQRQDFFALDGEVFGLTSYLQWMMMDYNAANINPK